MPEAARANGEGLGLEVADGFGVGHALVFFLRSEVMVPALIGRPGAFHAELGQDRIGIDLEHCVIAQDVSFSCGIQAKERPKPLRNLLIPRFDFVVVGLDVVVFVGPVPFEYRL
jgi:hypothetical protein